MASLSLQDGLVLDGVPEKWSMIEILVRFRQYSCCFLLNSR